jgi:hypothetical protein
MSTHPGMPIAIEYIGRNQYMIDANKPVSNIPNSETMGSRVPTGSVVVTSNRCPMRELGSRLAALAETLIV